MIKTVLKIDGMMCGMCESHMNDVVRKSCSPKKVNSSAKNGETVVISEAPLDIPYLKQQIKDIGYDLFLQVLLPWELQQRLPFLQRRHQQVPPLLRELLLYLLREHSHD